MVQEGALEGNKKREPTLGRLTTYLGVGLVLLGAIWGLRQAVLWWNDPFRLMEKRVGFHLYRPTHLPYGMKLADNGVIRGAHRVVWAYTSERCSVHIGQEKRTPERDRYNLNEFEGQVTKVNGRPATFSRDELGHWRLFWQTDDVTIILTSANLTQEEMIRIAESMR
ncbi:MAG: DUF4367 domain-containing protein [Abditibacteriales bacterium]|nr:DUF4367 domain-containing protein [Abditibacteriales bacterium]MDW8364206.1 DUF4367 domain-containing protein [Abditibacteriales bacterium]